MEGGSRKRRSSGTRSNAGTDRACGHACTCDRLKLSCDELLCWPALQLACLEYPTKEDLQRFNNTVISDKGVPRMALGAPNSVALQNCMHMTYA